MSKYKLLTIFLLLITALYFTSSVSAASSLSSRLQGYILLQVESVGEAWYVIPKDQTRVYMPNGSSAYQIMRYLSLGITNADLSKIPVGIESKFNDQDQDKDGLSDNLEKGLGTDPNKADTDNDSFSDGEELKNNFNPLGASKLTYNTTLVNRLKGYILLQVEKQGQAWYLNPKDGKRYYMQDGDAAYQIMRFLSLGITNQNLNNISISKKTFTVDTTPPISTPNPTPTPTPTPNPTPTPPGGGGGGGGGGTTPPSTPTPDYDSDNDGYNSTANGGSDCNDSNANIRPNATEICDSIDNNCNSQIDEGNVCVIPTPDYDNDNDSYNATTNGGDDCNDSNASIHPGATEICSDGVDQDCSGGLDLVCSTCSQGAITSRCLCGTTPYTSGYCCSNIYQTNSCPVSDTTPPSIPTNLSATVSGTQASLTWTASTDNTAVTGYNILRSTTNGTGYQPLATSNTNSYTNTGLTTGTTYYYVVRAYDAGGYTSGNSNQAIAAIASAPPVPTGSGPSISSLSDNSLNNGQSITISGSGFGVNDNTPSHWDNFDDGQAQNMDLVSSPGMYDPDVNSSEKHSGNYSLRTRLGDPNIDTLTIARNGYAMYWFPQAMQGGEKAFISFWERWDWGVWYCAAGGQARVDYQIKNFRVSSGAQATYPPYFAQNNQSDCSGYDTTSFYPRPYLTHTGGDGHAIDTTWYGRDFEPELAQPDKTWMLFEIQLQQSHDGQSDGSFEVWLTRAGQSRKIVDYQNINTHQLGDPGFNKLVMGNWIDAYGRSTTLYFDDLFVDFSWQRVVIANNSNYQLSNKREIQPYTNWGDGSISINAKLDAFSPTDNLYLFVLDENGEPGLGYRVYMN